MGSVTIQLLKSIPRQASQPGRSHVQAGAFISFKALNFLLLKENIQKNIILAEMSPPPLTKGSFS